MKLHYHPISDNCRRVLATIHELGREDVELQVVDLFNGEHKKPEFLKINPNGKVPVLEDGDVTMWESTAIMQYLAGESSLWPPNKLRFDIIRWQVWAVAHLGPAIDTIVFERMIKKTMGLGNPDETKIEKAIADFKRFAAVLDGHLEGRSWMVGDDITLADISIAAKLTYAPASAISIGPFDNINRWYSTIESRDSWLKSAPPKMG